MSMSGGYRVGSDGFLTPDSFRKFVAIATYRQAEESLVLSSDQWEAFRAAWLLSAFHYSDGFIAARARLSRVIAQASR